MAWNASRNKSLGSDEVKSLIGPGAPVAYNSAMAGRPYRDGWDIERAYREGMQKVTWVSRCIDAIAGNQARLPIILRKNNSSDGQIIKPKNNQLLEIFNVAANQGENSFLFRYRLSSQLLMSTRGVFIEKVRGRDGGVIALHLLPPQHMSPIPHPKKFVSGFELQMPNGYRQELKTEDVLWIRKPHPLDPYLSLTPMESAGIAIEIENLAKVYNRNFLLNDGRPGGLLVVRGEIDDDDKDELRNRFRGNLAKTGYTSVISADDGVDYVDTSASPRDAAYIQMRQLTKEEILAAFGVPESVIGNASGRTFSNAAEEIRVFWMETMLPHLEPLARALDELDDKYYIDFDLSEVPILQLYKQERERYLLQEFQTGLISSNEYRIGSGRKETESDLADSLLMNPNLIPISNTKKKMEEQSAEVAGPQGVPGMPGGPGVPGLPPTEGQVPGGAPVPPTTPGPEVLDPNTMAGALAQTTLPPEAAAAIGTEAAPGPMQNAAVQPAEQSSLLDDSPEQKSDDVDDEQQALARWGEILNRSIERVIERQQRVVLEKASGAKSRKALNSGTLDVDSILSPDVWDRQMEEDIRPVISAIIQDSYASYNEHYGKKTGIKIGKGIPRVDLDAQIDSQMTRIKKINEENLYEIKQMMFSSLSIVGEEQRATAFRGAVVGLYANLMAKDRFEIAEDETRRAWQFGQRV